MITETISTTELLWTLASWGGASASLWAALFFLHRAREVSQKKLNGGLRVLAWGRFWLRLCLVTGQFALGLAGYIQMFLPPANPDVPVSLGAVITVVAIILGNAMFSICAIGEVILLNKVKSMPKRESDFSVIHPVAPVGS